MIKKVELKDIMRELNYDLLGLTKKDGNELISNFKGLKMENKTIIKDTSLCSIVRDEKINPAGGIQLFIDSHVPFVEEAVIVDTGSIDGTREILEEMSATYSNLRVFDKKFRGYANARNFSLKKVKTKNALILDADEVFTHKKPKNDFEEIQKNLDNHPAKSYCFRFENIFFENERYDVLFHNLRLFEISKKIHYEGFVWEGLLNYPISEKRLNISIKHFVPRLKAKRLKQQSLYLNLEKNPLFHMLFGTCPPSQIKGFGKWKEYNPKRDDFK